MVQQLRILSVLPEDLELPAPTLQLIPATPGPENIAPSHRHAGRQNTSTHKNK